MTARRRTIGLAALLAAALLVGFVSGRQNRPAPPPPDPPEPSAGGVVEISDLTTIGTQPLRLRVIRVSHGLEWKTLDWPDRDQPGIHPVPFRVRLPDGTDLYAVREDP